ncbi:MAG: metal transporter CNNM [Akkermansiaceae bacterium]|jgi:metal transporter CNNM
MEYLTWLGIFFCLIHSAVFSGCNLAFFSLGRLRLEAEAQRGNKSAHKVLNLRQDSNLLLCTILWGNVSANVLLALLSDSALNGLYGFLFSTIGITFFGEIMPQAYFSRNALKVGGLLSPVIRFYQILLYPITKPCAILLDGWIGPEGPSFFDERDIEIILERHIDEEDSEISANEGQGALNFLDLDDRKIIKEGSELGPETIYQFPTKFDLSILPSPDTAEGRDFIESLKKHPHRWAIIINESQEPVIVMDTTKFLCDLNVEGDATDPYAQCHRPIVVTEEETYLDSVLGEFVVEAEDLHDHVVDRDVVLYWTTDHKRIITGADIFGRLLKGIAKRIPAPKTVN